MRVSENEKNTLAQNLELLIEYLRNNARTKDSIVINLNDREVARALKELGVVFA